MRYDLIVDGVRFPGQQHEGGLDPQALLNQEYGRWMKDGSTSYLKAGDKDAVLVNWGRVSTVQVVVTNADASA